MFCSDNPPGLQLSIAKPWSIIEVAVVYLLAFNLFLLTKGSDC